MVQRLGWCSGLVAGVALVAAGCNLGRSVDKLTLRRLAPGFMTVGDLGLACTSGESLAPLMIALGHKSGGRKEPKKSAALTLIAAAMCSERAAWDAELRRSRLLYQVAHGGGAGAGQVLQDLTIEGQRAHREAASRNLAAYQRIVAVYGEPGDPDECPRLAEGDQLLYLLGLTAGLLATIHAIQAERSVGVLQSIPRRVADGVACVDDDRWWGLPGALGAAVAASIPGAAVPGQDPWADLEAAARRGEAAGIGLGRALQLQAAAGAGDHALVWAAIAAHAAARRGPVAEDPNYALLNAYAAAMIEHRSDLLWLEAVGTRTPIGRLGERPPVAISAADADELLEGLEGFDELDDTGDTNDTNDTNNTSPAIDFESIPGDGGPPPVGGLSGMSDQTPDTPPG